MKKFPERIPSSFKDIARVIGGECVGVESVGNARRVFVKNPDGGALHTILSDARRPAPIGWRQKVKNVFVRRF